MARATLAAIAEHPELVTGTNRAAIKVLLSEIAGTLSRYKALLTPHIVPEVTRVILENTGQNLELIWPGLRDDPENHLLLTAAKTTLPILSQVPEDGAGWTLTFGRGDILTVLDTDDPSGDFRILDE